MVRLFSITLLAALSVHLSACSETSFDAKLDGLDARKAIAIANKWFEEKQPVKSFVNAREVVFEFKDGKTRRISLPADEMVVAIAPYVQKTHT